jgi:hypothetical protein
MIEHFFECPHCWQTISMLLDSSLEDTEYVEDCEVCCNPISLAYGFENGELQYVNTTTIDQ